MQALGSATPSPIDIPLERSKEFPVSNPIKPPKTLSEKEFVVGSNSSDDYSKETDAIDSNQILQHSTLKTTAIALKGLSKTKSRLDALHQKMSLLANSNHTTQTPQNPEEIREIIILYLAAIFEDDPLLIKKQPLDLFQLKTLENGETILHISRAAMGSFIQIHNALYPGHARPLDFSFCSLEDDALVPLLEKVSFLPNMPTIRISRNLTIAEKQILKKRTGELLAALPSEKTIAWNTSIANNEITESKTVFVPVYIAKINIEQLKRTEPLQVQEFYSTITLHCYKWPKTHHTETKSVPLVLRDVGLGLITMNFMAAANDKYDPAQLQVKICKISLQKYKYTRMSFEYHPAKNFPEKLLLLRKDKTTTSSSKVASFSSTSIPIVTQGSSPIPANGRSSTPSSPMDSVQVSNTSQQSSPMCSTSSSSDSTRLFPPIRKPLPPPPAKKQHVTLPARTSNDSQPLSIDLLTKGKQALKRNEFGEAANAFFGVLKEAKIKNDRSQIFECLLGLGKVELEFGKADSKYEHWIIAATIFNAAYAIGPPDKQEIALEWMAEVERSFLRNTCALDDSQIESAVNPDLYMQRRKKLDEYRNSINSTKNTEDCARIFSNKIIQFDSEIIAHICKTLGISPKLVAWILIGSGHRRELCPYSDFEGVMLKANKSELLHQKLKNAAILFEIHTINLGETPCHLMKGWTPKGRCFDDGGNTFLGKATQGKESEKKSEELIKTPEELAAYQSPHKFDERYGSQADMILSHVLNSASLLWGNPELLNDYYIAKARYYNGIRPGEKLSFRELRGLKIMQDSLPPDLFIKMEERYCFDIKKKFMRPISFFIQGLCIYLNIDDRSDTLKTFTLLSTLKDKYIQYEAYLKLYVAFSTALRLRYRCHLHYKTECDFAYHPFWKNENNEVKDPFMLTVQDMKEIIYIYRVLFPLNAFIQSFVEKPDLNELRKQTFSEPTLFKTWEKTFDEA